MPVVLFNTGAKVKRGTPAHGHGFSQGTTQQGQAPQAPEVLSAHRPCTVPPVAALQPSIPHASSSWSSSLDQPYRPGPVSTTTAPPSYESITQPNSDFTFGDDARISQSMSRLGLCPAIDSGGRQSYHTTLPPTAGNQTLYESAQYDPPPVYAEDVPGNGDLQQLLTAKLDAVITSMDEEIFSGDEQELAVAERLVSPPSCDDSMGPNDSMQTTRSVLPITGLSALVPAPRTIRTNHFAKVWRYRNSRLPPLLPPLKVYMPTWPLLCLAAQYSERVYIPPTRREERELRIGADWRTGAKAMALKSIAVDDMNAIVLAIRGSQTFSDWAVNFRPAPCSPEDFLDDSGNLCHSGFLSVARNMLAPTAAHLEAILSSHSRPENSRVGPSSTRAAPSLLITGHSAGGAVAQLLYAHLSSSSTIRSPLKSLLSRFKRVHCITFGTPPVSLLPLPAPTTPAATGSANHTPPSRVSKFWRESLFFSFVNEGDPVTRADPAVIRSLLRLYATPAPTAPPAPMAAPLYLASSALGSAAALPPQPDPAQDQLHRKQKSQGKQLRKPKPKKANSWSGITSHQNSSPRPTWPVPQCTMSLAGRVVLLRSRQDPERSQMSLSGMRLSRGRTGSVGAAGGAFMAEACIVSDEQLRGVVFGDPMCHMMKLYAQRIEELATRAVLVREGGGMG